MKWGFDLTDFVGKEKWIILLKAHNINPQPELTKRGWKYTGKNVSIWTLYDPVRGTRYTNPDSEHQGSEGFAGYIGIEGEMESVGLLVKDIKRLGLIKDESPHRCDYI